MLDPVLAQCRALLEEVTPLRRDCGALCGAACCSSLEGEETGMLLFPGEEEACGDQPGFRITEGAGGKAVHLQRPLRAQPASAGLPAVPGPAGDPGRRDPGGDGSAGPGGLPAGRSAGGRPER